MKYLFYDLEYATQKGGESKICEFGYVITNETFEVRERSNLIINPNICRSEWDYRVVREILTRPISEYESKSTFPKFYNHIASILKNVDFVFGHTLDSDAKALNDELKRYDLHSIDYDFYDVKEIYKLFRKADKATSVTNILAEQNIQGETNNHDAETDSYNTMLILKEIVRLMNCSLTEVINTYSKAKDHTENYEVESIKRNQQLREEYFRKNITGDGTNDIRLHSDNKKRFLQFLDNAKAQNAGHGLLKGKKVSISMNYEEHHYKQMLNLVQIIVNEGGQYILKASEADIFVKYDVMDEEEQIRSCSRYNYVLEANQSGGKIEIIEFEKFLELIKITQEELDKMPMISFDFLYAEDAIIKDKNDKRILDRKKKESLKAKYSSQENMGYTIGDMFGNLLKKVE